MLHSKAVSSDPANCTPWLVATEAINHPHVDAIAQTGNTILIGGLFDQEAYPGGSPTYSVGNFAAFDASNCSLRAAVYPTFLEPKFDGQIWAIETFGDYVFIGGDFSSVSGLQRKLANLSATTGAVDTKFHSNNAGGVIWDLLCGTGQLGRRRCSS